MTLQIIKWLVILAVVGAVAFAVYALVKIERPLSSQAAHKNFTVVAGATTSEIAGNLRNQGLIARPLFFRLYILARGADGRIQAGEYLLSAAMSTRSIADALVAGEVISDAVRLTVIEGWTVADIGEALEAAGVMSQKDFARENMEYEGYLFPDTYFIDRGENAAAVGGKMRQNFEKKVGSVERDTLILASIIEREVGRNVKRGEKLSAQDIAAVRRERRLVAGIFKNRLRLGMALQSDATVAYITGSRRNRATTAETKIASPYNTYLHPGLPPGPIGNPGLEAIRAAQSPEETGYLYFVTDEEGRAYFARTLEEHNQNKEKYLK